MISHSKLPPSRAARRVACPGSRKLEEICIKDEDSPAAREGTLAHELAANMLRNPEWLDAVDGSITNEMIQGAQLYKKHIFDCLYDSHTPRNQLHIEETVSISTIHPDCFGTPDCWFFDGINLYIFDYKYGYRAVEVFENWQLIEYAAGIIEQLKNDGVMNIQHIMFTIIQPRSFHQYGTIRKWTITHSYLHQYFKTLRDAEEHASREHAVCYVSSECGNCAARYICPTLEQAALNAVDQTYLNIPHALDNVNLGKQLRTLKRAAALLEARIIGLSEEATSLIRKGENVPYFTLESGSDSMQWNVDIKEIVALGELMGINLEKPQNVLTPRQAMKAGIPFEVLNAYISYVPVAARLTEVHESVPRKIFSASIDKFSNNSDNNIVK